MKLLLYVGLGAAAGGMSRFVLAGYIQQRAGSDFPMGTLLVNLTGSFLLGFIMRVALHGTAVTPEMRALLTTGFCGGYTTFSTFGYETWLLLEDGEYGRAASYAVVSVLVGVVLIVAGMATAQRLLTWRSAGS